MERSPHPGRMPQVFSATRQIWEMTGSWISKTVRIRQISVPKEMWEESQALPLIIKQMKRVLLLTFRIVRTAEISLPRLRMVISAVFLQWMVLCRRRQPSTAARTQWNDFLHEVMGHAGK